MKQTVPKSKLLIFNVKEGIEPLAKFCGKPVPSWKMPYVNDSATFNEAIKMGKNTALVLYIGNEIISLKMKPIIIFSVLAVGIYGIIDGCAITTLVPIVFVILGRILMKLKDFEKDFSKDKAQ